MTALTAILGAGAGFGLFLIVGGCRPSQNFTRHRTSGLSRRQREHLTFRISITVGTAVLVGSITGWPVAALLAGVCAMALPKIIGGSKDRLRRVARTEAIAGWAEMLRDTLAAAAGLEQAIMATSNVAPMPIRNEVMSLAAALEHERLVPSLRTFADQLADPTGDLVVAALVLAAGHETRKLTELLGSLAAAARDQAAMQLRIEAGRARIRTSTNVVIGATLLFAAGLVLLNRSYLNPFGTSLGQGVLAIIGFIFGIAFWWLDKMGRPSSPERFLSFPGSGTTSATSVPGRSL